MATGWFLSPWVRATEIRPGRVRVTCALEGYKSQAKAEGGNLGWLEVLGGHTLTKVVANASTLTEIEGLTGVVRVLRKINLSDSLSDLTTLQYTVLRNKLLDLGYTDAEINAALGNNLQQWQAHTYGDLLDLIASRRKRIRYDSNTDTCFWDGPEQTQISTAMEQLDARVR